MGGFAPIGSLGRRVVLDARRCVRVVLEAVACSAATLEEYPCTVCGVGLGGGELDGVVGGRASGGNVLGLFEGLFDEVDEHWWRRLLEYELAPRTELASILHAPR
jgi:hypothetical protein